MTDPDPSTNIQTVRPGSPEALAHRLAHLADQLGSGAIGELRAALGHSDPWLRLHAVIGLGRLDDEEARAGLVKALHDDSFGVHWAAANALSAQGTAGATAVLRAMLHDIPATGFLHGAAHILRHATLTTEGREAVKPVLDALHRPAADLEAPVLAVAALERLAKGITITPEERAEPWWRIRRDRRGLRGHVFAPAGEAAQWLARDDAAPA